MLRENNLEWKCKKGYKIAPPARTKLDSLLSDEDDNNKNEQDHMSIDSADCVSSEEDVEDVVFQKSILPTRTGNFDIDFPPSPTVPRVVKTNQRGVIKQSTLHHRQLLFQLTTVEKIKLMYHCHL